MDLVKEVIAIQLFNGEDGLKRRGCLHRIVISDPAINMSNFEGR